MNCKCSLHIQNESLPLNKYLETFLPVGGFCFHGRRILVAVFEGTQGDEIPLQMPLPGIQVPKGLCPVSRSTALSAACWSRATFDLWLWLLLWYLRLDVPCRNPPRPHTIWIRRQRLHNSHISQASTSELSWDWDDPSKTLKHLSAFITFLLLW